ncbi:hypothetical protein OV079_11435 [Nannocystis pusilla]|uniref:Uncharacterized protein n=1 Tax=Nannocystis pusilla TaxID=889268 RepID=A0A9X3IXT2_9BACT|nr:hypothetical protein [Nannocystis pusilla]MCY1006163.1 hypothetical protein [Nannocystis pusilla]
MQGARRRVLGIDRQRRIGLGLLLEIDEQLVDAVAVDVERDGAAGALALPQRLDAQTAVGHELAEAGAETGVEERVAAVAVEVADQQVVRLRGRRAGEDDAAARIDALDVA